MRPGAPGQEQPRRATAPVALSRRNTARVETPPRRPPGELSPGRRGSVSPHGPELVAPTVHH